MAEEFSLSELDSELYKLLEEYKNLDLKLTIEFVEDLGIRVEAVSDGSVGRSGDSVSVTAALLRLLPKIRKTVEEYEERKAELIARIEADIEDEED